MRLNFNENMHVYELQRQIRYRQKINDTYIKIIIFEIVLLSESR